MRLLSTSHCNMRPQYATPRIPPIAITACSRKVTFLTHLNTNRPPFYHDILSEPSFLPLGITNHNQAPVSIAISMHLRVCSKTGVSLSPPFPNKFESWFTSSKYFNSKRNIWPIRSLHHPDSSLVPGPLPSACVILFVDAVLGLGAQRRASHGVCPATKPLLLSYPQC
jgi:hypothetical protein